MLPALADGAAAEEVDDGEQNDRADKRGEKDAAVEGVAHDRALGADERPEQEAAEQRADDSDDDVEQDALLRIGAHHDAGEPADNATDDKCDDETQHECYSYKSSGPLFRPRIAV